MLTSRCLYTSPPIQGQQTQQQGALLHQPQRMYGSGGSRGSNCRQGAQVVAAAVVEVQQMRRRFLTPRPPLGL